MNAVNYDSEITALLLIDPYNDFISEGGKVWERLRGMAEANSCIPHMTAVLNRRVPGPKQAWQWALDARSVHRATTLQSMIQMTSCALRPCQV